MFANRNTKARIATAQAMLTSAAALAAGLALGGAPAFGQAFQGGGVVQSGSATIDRMIPGLDVVTVGSQQTVINWTPSDTAVGGGSINFLPTGTEVRYQNNSAVTDYVVLNRILPVDPSRPVQFNGRVFSQLTDAGGTTAQGGAVWFYSPGGIIAGAGSVFDVGSLVLTASDPVVDGSGNFFTGGTAILGQATAGSRIDIQAGAAINATPEGSYVAIVAPTITQSGTVTVNGSAAYVAAEAAQITILNGLFDINVTVGSTGDGSPLEHYGTTTGPASTGTGDNHRIYLVSIPKNDAVTMLVQDGSQLGFDVAGAADVVNNVVVLSAGRNVSDTSFVGPAAPFDASIHIHGTNFTSAVTGRATTDAYASSLIAGSQFASDVTLQGGANAHISSRISGETVTIGGNVTLIADAFGDISTPVDVTAGQALLYADAGGTVNILGNVNLSANAVGGGNPGGTGTTGSGTGGRAHFNANGGTITVGGDVTLSADGSAGSLDSAGVDGGNGTGGQAFVTTDLGGSIDIGGSVSMSADGFGGANRGGGDGVSGTGTGGLANVTAITGTIDIQGDVSSTVLGSGGFVLEGTTGGVGQGGETNVSAGAGTLLIGGDVTVAADGSGGSGSSTGIGGAGTGGTARISIYQPGGSLTLTGTSIVSALGTGGFSFSDPGGGGTGGIAEIAAIGGTLTLDTEITIDSSGLGGDGSTGGAGTGGRSSIVAREGAIVGTGGAMVTGVVSTGNGGSGQGGGNGGTGTGGIAEILALSGTSASSVTLDTVTVDATGFGGRGGTAMTTGGTGGRGGDGIGGIAGMLGSAGNGVLNIDVGIGLAVGTGGDGGNGGDGSTVGGAGGRGGDGIGGNVSAGTQSGLATPDNTGSATFTQLILSNDGEGGFGGNGGGGPTLGAGGRGGDGFGGPNGVVLLVRGSPVTVADATLSSSGTGGDGGTGSTAGDGGDGEGGTAGIIVTERFQSTEPGSLDAGSIGVLVEGVGGAGGTAGASRYGSADIQVRSSTIDADAITLQVIGDTPGAVGAASPSSVSAVNGTLTATNGLSMTTPGNIALVADGGTIQADVVSLDAGGAILDRIDPVGPAPTAPGVVRGNFISVSAGTDITTAAGFETGSSLSFISNGAISLGDLTGDGVFVTAIGNITVGNIVSDDVVELLSDAGAVSAGDITALSDVELTAANGSVIAGAIVSGDSVTAVSGTSVAITSISAGIVNPSTDPLARYRVGIDAGTTMIIGAIDAVNDIGLLSRAGTMTVGPVTTDGSLLMLGSSGITLAGATTGTGANQAVYIADISMESLLGPDFDPTPLFAVAPIRLAGPISITGDIATGSFGAASTGAISAQGVSVTDRIYVDTGQTLAFAQALTAPGAIDLIAEGGITTADLQAGGDITLTSSAGDIDLGAVTSANYVDVNAGGAVSGASIDAGEIGVSAGGNIMLGNLTSSRTAADNPDSQFTVGLRSGGAINVGNISSQLSVALIADGGSATTGTILVANGDLLALTTGGVSLGGITAAPGGTIYIAHASMASLAGPTGDPSAIYAATPVSTNGAISISGPVATGRFVAAGQSFAAQGALAAQSTIEIDAAGLATFNGLTTAPTISVASGDIAIGSAGGLGGSGTTSIALDSTNSAGTVIGGSGTATGYVLDNAEAQRLRAAGIVINAVEVATAPSIVIRDLSLNGADGGSAANLTSATGAFVVATQGTIRVTGNATFSNMASGNVLRMNAGKRAEVVTDAGSIGLFGSGTTLSGVLDVFADNIHVAGGSLISQLATDPRFQGRDQQLARVAGTARPEGFVQAGRIQLAANDTILIQNSSALGTFGGFTAGAGGMEVVSTAQSDTPVDLVIYGRLADSSGGFIVNKDVRDAITVTSSSSDGFSATSAVNGCLLTASICEDIVPVPEEDGPVGTIATDVLAITEQEVTPEPLIEEEEEEAAQKATTRSPIARPVALIDTRSMDADPTIEEPVTSGGNSSLIGGFDQTSSTNPGGGE